MQRDRDTEIQLESFRRPYVRETSVVSTPLKSSSRSAPDRSPRHRWCPTPMVSKMKRTKCTFRRLLPICRLLYCIIWIFGAREWKWESFSMTDLKLILEAFRPFLSLDSKFSVPVKTYSKYLRKVTVNLNFHLQFCKLCTGQEVIFSIFHALQTCSFWSALQLCKTWQSWKIDSWARN